MALFALLACLSVLIACSGDNDTESATTTTDPTSELAGDEATDLHELGIELDADEVIDTQPGQPGPPSGSS